MGTQDTRHWPQLLCQAVTDGLTAMSEFYRPPENAEEPSSEDHPAETTPAEVFGREAETVAVSRTTDRTTTGPRSGYGDGSYGTYGYGEQRSTADVRRFEVKHPRQAVELDQDTQIVTTTFNPRKDAWEVVTSTPR